MDLNAILAAIPAQYLAYVSAAVTIAAALVAVLPAPKNMRTGYAYAWRVLDYIALNIGHGQTTAKALATGAVMPVLPPKAIQPAPVVVAPPAPPAA